jgi:Na+/H+ antiporter NhaD/arsenite permease-like protein
VIEASSITQMAEAEILIFTMTMEVLIRWRSQERSFTQVVSFLDKNISGNMPPRKGLIFIVSQSSTIKMGQEETLM